MKEAAAEKLRAEIKHATIQIGEFTVPLIGVDGEAVLETCDLCHDVYGLQQIELTGTQFLCIRCRSILNTTLNTTGSSIQPPQSSGIRKGVLSGQVRKMRVVIEEM
jgi:hypothetical protein